MRKRCPAASKIARRTAPGFDTSKRIVVPLPFEKAEGVAVDAAAGRVYIVSESEDRLYVYSIEFPE